MDGHSLRILYADDNKIEQELLKAIAKKHKIISAHNAKEALSKDDGFDVIIIDINLGNDNGYELYQQLKHRYDCKFMIISGLLPDTDIHISERDTLMDKNAFFAKAKNWNVDEWIS